MAQILNIANRRGQSSTSLQQELLVGNNHVYLSSKLNCCLRRFTDPVPCFPNLDTVVVITAADVSDPSISQSLKNMDIEVLEEPSGQH